MKVNLELNTSEKNDITMMSMLGTFLANNVESIYVGGAKEDENKTDETIVSPEESAEEPSPEVEEHIEPKVEEKPKRTRKPRAKKEEVIETPIVDEPQEPVEVEAPTASEVEKAAQVEDSAPVAVEADTTEEPSIADIVPPKVNKCSTEQWRKILRDKLVELRIVNDKDEPGDNFSRRPILNDFIHKISEDYGDRIPSRLTPERLYDFVQQFSRIEWNAETKEFELSAPF